MWRIKLKYRDGTEFKTDRLTLRDIIDLILVKKSELLFDIHIYRV